MPEAPAILALALCSGGSEQLQSALDALKGATESPTFLEVIPILDHVWHGDLSLGVQLPWQALQGEDVRATLVYSLAQQVPLGRSRIPLKQMQALAIKLSRRDAPLGATQGITLLGLTHTPGQVEFLKALFASSTQLGYRVAVIRTLGGVCDPEAGAFLAELQRDPDMSSEERPWTTLAIQSRTTLSERTCRLAREGTP